MISIVQIWNETLWCERVNPGAWKLHRRLTKWQFSTIHYCYHHIRDQHLQREVRQVPGWAHVEQDGPWGSGSLHQEVLWPEGGGDEKLYEQRHHWHLSSHRLLHQRSTGRLSSGQGLCQDCIIIRLCCLGSLPTHGPVLQDKMLYSDSLPRNCLRKALYWIKINNTGSSIIQSSFFCVIKT